ncbi:MAG: hypothetical protein U9R19_17295 [Bacteroidota bacterium]|nr:hypothetical protein [Bacteroidota bacterium]
METQSRIQQVTTVLGESLVGETITKLAQIEEQKCLKKIGRIKSELLRYEKQFAINSEEAWEKYQNGWLGDDFDIMEWMSLFENKKALQRQYDRITKN